MATAGPLPTKMPINPPAATPAVDPVEQARQQRVAMGREMQRLRLEIQRLTTENVMLRELVGTHRAHSENLTMIVSQLISNAPSPTPQFPMGLPPPPSYSYTPPRG